MFYSGKITEILIENCCTVKKALIRGYSEYTLN